jgi:hypothetical protein
MYHPQYLSSGTLVCHPQYLNAVRSLPSCPFMLLYENSAFVLMKTAASFSFLKIYRKGAESVLQLLLLNLSVMGG